MRRLLALVLVLAACGGQVTTSARGGQLSCSQCQLQGDGSYLVDFGNVLLGDYVERGVVVENRGSAKLTVELPAIAPPFSCASCNRLELAPGRAGRVTLGFAPASIGEQALDLSVKGDGKAPVRFHLRGLGTKATFACTPQLVDFGGWRVGARSGPLTVSCSNTANVSLQLVVQPAEAPFATTAEPEVVQVDPGRTLEVPVTFQPDHVGDAFGNLAITSEGHLRVAQVALAGTGLDHRIEVLPQGCADFGYVTLGTSRTLPVTVRNVSAAPLSVTEISLDGPFTFLPAAPIDLAPAGKDGDRADVSVTFSPAGLMSYTGSLNMLTDDPRTPQQVVCLTGAGGGPTIRCDPSERAFGVTAIGSPRTLPFTCTNTGYDHPDTLADGLVIASATTDDPHFTAQVQAGGPLQVGQSTEVDVTYAPDATDGDVGTLQIASNDSADPVVSLPLSGEGRAFTGCTFSLAPQALDFGKVPPGQEVQLAVAVRNDGATDCLAGDARILPGGSDAFHLGAGAPDLARALAPGQQLLVPVVYAPQAAGIHDADLTLYVNGAPPQRVALHGVSAAPCLLIRPAPLDFGVVAPGCATQARYLEMENRCADGVTVESVGTAASASEPFANLPHTIDAGDFFEVALVYHPAPDAVADDFGAALVQLRAEDAPWAVALRGRAAGTPVQKEVFLQHERPTVDVLFVVDGQPGMETAQAMLATPEVRDAFLGYAREQKIDFHVGVTNASVAVNATCVADGRLLPLSGKRYMASDADAGALWTTLMAPGSCSFGKPQGLEAALRAVTPPVASSVDDPRHPEPADGNAGFLRRNAHLAVVFVSTDDDHSTGTVASYLTAYRATKGARRDNLFSAHAVIHPPGSVCTGTIAEGTRYADLVRQTFGEVVSVCATDWTGNMDLVGRSAFGYEQCFELTNVPEGTGSSDGWFTVTVGGKPYPALGVGGQRRWEYLAEENALCFRPLFIPEPGIEVDVDYGVACLP